MTPQQQRAPSVRSFPVGPFSAGVALVCVALAASAIYSYRTLSRLENDFLESRGQDLVTLLDAQTRGRGPGGRTDAGLWQSAIEESLQTNAGTLVFVEVNNSRGELIARAGEERPDVYLFERPLPTPRRGAQRGAEASAAWQVRAGLDRSSTAFITRAARVQVVASLVGILALITTAAYLLRTARRYVALEAQEQQARHLADLGRMAATLAHEIRNPLGAVKGLTQVASEKIPADHVTQGHLRTVVNEAERLERLVTDLLQFARPRQPELSRLDLVDAAVQARNALLSGRAEDDAEVLIELQGANVDGSGELWIRADPDGVRQVLLNVLLNAIQAAPEAPRVHVGLGPAGRTGHVEVVVDDNGPGLQGEDPEELFSPFSTTKTRGSGLGLAVSRQIVEQLGGTIRLQDRQGGGARCTIRFPIEPPRRIQP